MAIQQEFWLNKKLVQKIEDFIGDGFYSYEKLKDDDKDDLIYLCLEHRGENAYECISESEEIRLTIYHLREFMKHRKKESAMDLVETIVKGTHEYFKSSLTEMFEEIYHGYKTEFLRERKDLENNVSNIKWTGLDKHVANL